MKLASIEKVTKVFPHPNADKLEFVHVLGYDCLVSKGNYKTDDLIVLIQPDTVLPQAEWTDIYRKVSTKRVKAIRLRGEWSFGIVEKLSLLPTGMSIAEGLEVAEFLGITKRQGVAAFWNSQNGRRTLPKLAPRGLPGQGCRRNAQSGRSKFYGLLQRW
jgi:RNA ligase (TIGR02306 family)